MTAPPSYVRRCTRCTRPATHYIKDVLGVTEGVAGDLLCGHHAAKCRLPTCGLPIAWRTSACEACAKMTKRGACEACSRQNTPQKDEQVKTHPILLRPRGADIFKTTCEALVVTTNGLGTQGAGLAKRAAQLCPRWSVGYTRWCREKNPSPGDVCVAG